MISIIINCLKKLFDFLLPHICLLCHITTQRNIDLCLDCEEELPKVEHACDLCGTILSRDIIICGKCLLKPPPCDRTIVTFKYEIPVTKLIIDLKFHAHLVNAHILGTLMAMHIKKKVDTLPDYIIPVPLHRKRLQSRGYNQAIELARPISKLLRIPIARHACQRIRATAAQSNLPARKRAKNIKDAFHISPSFSANYIAIVDDVMTTGETTMELAKTFRKYGIHKIEIWCCAKTS